MFKVLYKEHCFSYIQHLRYRHRKREGTFWEMQWLLLEFNNLTTYSSPFKRKFYTAITFIKINTDSYSFSFALSPSLSLTHTQRLEEKERSERPWYKCINAKRKELKSWIVVLVCEYPGKWSWPLISLWRLFCHWLNS